MQEAGLFSLKYVANLLDQPITPNMIDGENRELIRRLLERHISLGTLAPDFYRWPTLANPVDDLRPLDLHRTLNVEDFFVKSAGLVASLRGLAIESASLAASLYGLKLEIDELERQKGELEKYLNEPMPDANNPTAEPLADAMVQDALRAYSYYAQSEISYRLKRAGELRAQALQWHTIGGPSGTYADPAIQYQRAIARASNWKSTGSDYQSDEWMKASGKGPDNVRDAAGDAAYQLEAIQHYERKHELEKEADALSSFANEARALNQTYINNLERAKYNRAMVRSRLAALEMLLKSRRALYPGKRGDPTDPRHPFDPTCPDEIDILGRLHAVSVRYAHERRLLRKYLMALLHAYR